MMSRMLRQYCIATLALALVACANASSGDGDDIDASYVPTTDARDDVPVIDAAPGIDTLPGVEICNGQDDDGDQFIDEGAPEDLCAAVPNGTPRCNGLLGCVIDACEDGYYDIDMQVENGCECSPDAAEDNSVMCADARNLGSFADSSTSMEVTGNIVGIDDEDWYSFTANDSADSSCDSFHARALLVENPSDQFVIDVWRGGCNGSQICSGVADMQWYTNFSAGGVGECPCGPTSTNHCGSDTATFVVRVRRRAGMPLTCDNYKLEVSNGKYPAP
jgi:hypothetical protein